MLVGRAAPTFEAAAYLRGEEEPVSVSLADYRGKWVVLFFYPRDFTFICPTEIQSFAALHEHFEAEQAAVIAASTDSFFSHKAWYETDPRLSQVVFPVIADTGHHLSSAYDVLVDDGSTLRATYVIDPGAVVRHVYVNDGDKDGAGVGRNVAETLRTLRALRTGELCQEGWEPGELTVTGALTAVALEDGAEREVAE